MARQVVANIPAPSFDFAVVEGDSGDSNTLIASPGHISIWIDPTAIKLRHHIGRGSFGDVWLPTQYRASDDYEDYHEVAVKMLHPVKEDSIREVLNRLNGLLHKCQGSETVCCLHGLTVINKKKGSVGDRMSRLKEGKLSLSDVLRYDADLAQSIMDLHAKEILILNLKPSNFLLKGNDKAIVGDVGIPYVLLGIPLPSSDMARRLGTPNYMASEQWQPEVRGPVSVMFTGRQPW